MMVTGSRPTYRPDVEGHAEAKVTTVYEVYAVDGARMLSTDDKGVARGFALAGLLVIEVATGCRLAFTQ